MAGDGLVSIKNHNLLNSDGKTEETSMTRTLFILNDAPYGNERIYNALRLAGALVAKEDQHVRMFLLADAVTCAKDGRAHV